MEFPDRYPRREPKVFEVGGRIPRTPDRHINGGGDCCITVWEHWLATAPDQFDRRFHKGAAERVFSWPILGREEWRMVLRRTTPWSPGLEEPYADALRIPTKRECLLYHLRLLSQDWPKGHWPCPCGSGKMLQHCHLDNLLVMHRRVPLTVARPMLRRFNSAA
jgi:hypothetical protein